MRLLLLLLCLQPALLSAAPRVVTSIAPLYEITSAIMDGIAKPRVIIEDHQSAHHFAFKPSHMQQLQQAELVIWVDRHFEAGFNRVPEILPATAQTLELLPRLGIEDNDGHFWYSPSLLQESISIVTRVLSEIDPDHRPQYQANARQLKQAVSIWREGLQERWRNAPVRLLTDHEFLTHFAHDLKFFDIQSIQDHHDSHGGLKALDRIENWIRLKPVACLLTLESDPPPLAVSLVAKYRIGIVSIAGDATARPGHIAFQQRLDRLALALEACAQSGNTNQ